jgi:hypothetical protein
MPGVELLCGHRGDWACGGCGECHDCCRCLISHDPIHAASRAMWRLRWERWHAKLPEVDGVRPVPAKSEAPRKANGGGQ